MDCISELINIQRKRLFTGQSLLNFTYKIWYFYQLTL